MQRTRDELRAAFKEAYASLNAAQKKAVNTIDGPVMVIAGPGTGKTQILALRIANILLSTDTAPESILALTFTDAGAVNMRARLAVYLGGEAYRVPVFTFHAFSEHLIRTYPEAYDRIVGGRLATDVERNTYIEQLLDDGAFRHLRPPGNPTFHVGTILRQLSELKREAINPDALARIIAQQEAQLAATERVHEKGAHKGKVRGEYQKLEKVIERNRELLVVYRQYEALLVQDHVYDYDDMILETIATLEQNEDMRLSVQETYQYILADEHQDVNGGQNRILKLISEYHDRPNIFVVGDEKQAIFRFQGASLENFLYFENAFGEAEIIALTENYRSGQTILDTAHSLIAVDEGPLKELRIPLTARADAVAGQVLVTQFGHQAIEDDELVARIQAELADGTAPEEIAVIVRTNREVEAVAGRLRGAGLTVMATADTDALVHPITRSIIALATAAVDPRDELALAEVLHGAYTGIERADLVRILAAQNYQQSLTALIADPVAATVSDPVPFERLTAALQAAAAGEGAESPHRLLARLLTDTGLIHHVTTHDPVNGPMLIRRLYDEVEAMVQRDPTISLRGVLDTFARYQRYGLSITVPFIRVSSGAITVMTAHKAKGLEFEVVFAPHMLDTMWGGSTRSSFFTLPITRHVDATPLDARDDERRLFYVLLTRAKRAVYLSYAERNADGKECTPSQFISELNAELLDSEINETAAAAFDPLAAVAPPPPSVLSVDVFTALFAERGLSATALNNYRKSPWNFIYRNLLRLPDVRSESLLFGSAVHDVLEAVTRHWTAERTLPSDTDLLSFIRRALSRLPLSATEYTRLHDRALQALVPYTASFTERLSVAAEVEQKISVRFQTGVPALPELTLTGKLDRLDLDESGRVLRVVDYKTGKPKTRAVIEGTTKGSDGGYKRQLVFYALLLELQENERLRTRTGVISFVEPDSRGTHRADEVFTIKDDDIADLRTSITEMVQVITTGSFLELPCDDAQSEYCHLVDLLRGR